MVANGRGTVRRASAAWRTWASSRLTEDRPMLAGAFLALAGSNRTSLACSRSGLFVDAFRGAFGRRVVFGGVLFARGRRRSRRPRIRPFGVYYLRNRIGWRIAVPSGDLAEWFNPTVQSWVRHACAVEPHGCGGFVPVLLAMPDVRGVLVAEAETRRWPTCDRVDSSRRPAARGRTGELAIRTRCCSSFRSLPVAAQTGHAMRTADACRWCVGGVRSACVAVVAMVIVKVDLRYYVWFRPDAGRLLARRGTACSGKSGDPTPHRRCARWRV